jgi:hypothetical protein
MRSVVLWTSLGVGALSAALALLLVWPAARRATHPARPELAKSELAAAVLFEASPVHEAIFALAAQPLPQLVRVTGDMRCGDAEMGSQLVADNNARYGMAGPQDNPDPHFARRLPERGSPAAFGALADMGLRQQQSGSRAPTAPFGRDSALGTDQESARGNMWGEALNDNAGEDGLGRRGTPGGLAKHLDAQPMAENGTSMLRVLHTGLRVTGARKPSEVGRAMAAHFDELRGCGEDAQPTRSASSSAASSRACRALPLPPVRASRRTSSTRSTSCPRAWSFARRSPITTPLPQLVIAAASVAVPQLHGGMKPGVSTWRSVSLVVAEPTNVNENASFKMSVPGGVLPPGLRKLA